MRRVTVVSMALVCLLASGCEDPDTNDYDPMGAAAADAGMVLTDVPLDEIDSCVESTKFRAFTGDADALQRWNAAGQNDDALRQACTKIGLKDPDELAAMHWNWVAEQGNDGQE